MKQETTVVESNEQQMFANKVETIKTRVKEHFNKYLSPEFASANEDLGKRSEILLESFANYKDGIELGTEYVIEGEALVHLRKVVDSLIEDVTKGVDETNNYIALYDTVMSNENTSVILKQSQLQYVGEMFSKCSFQTIDEARTIKASQDALRPVFNELFFNTKEIQMAAQMVQTIENGWRVEGLAKEDAETVDADAQERD